jgi:hypothetical protein
VIQVNQTRRTSLSWSWSYGSLIYNYLCNFNATFISISVISWLSGLLVEKTGVPEESHRPVASHWQTPIGTVKDTLQQLILNNSVCWRGRCRTNFPALSIISFIPVSITVSQCSLFLCMHDLFFVGLGAMVFNTTYNIISVISWRSVLCCNVSFTVPMGRCAFHDSSHTTFSAERLVHVYTTRFNDYIGICKSNYHTITTTTAPYCV